MSEHTVNSWFKSGASSRRLLRWANIVSLSAVLSIPAEALREAAEDAAQHGATCTAEQRRAFHARFLAPRHPIAVVVGPPSKSLPEEDLQFQVLSLHHHAGAGDWKSSESVCRGLLDRLGPNDPRYADVACWLGEFALNRGDSAQVEAALRSANLSRSLQVLPPPTQSRIEVLHARLLMDYRDDYPKAEHHAKRAYELAHDETSRARSAHFLGQTIIDPIAFANRVWISRESPGLSSVERHRVERALALFYEGRARFWHDNLAENDRVTIGHVALREFRALALLGRQSDAKRALRESIDAFGATAQRPIAVLDLAKVEPDRRAAIIRVDAALDELDGEHYGRGMVDGRATRVQVLMDARALTRARDQLHALDTLVTALLCAEGRHPLVRWLWQQLEIIYTELDSPERRRWASTLLDRLALGQSPFSAIGKLQLDANLLVARSIRVATNISRMVSRSNS